MGHLYSDRVVSGVDGGFEKVAVDISVAVVGKAKDECFEATAHFNGGKGGCWGCCSALGAVFAVLV